MPTRTPFHSRTSTLCVSQNWRIWSGYLVASSYGVLHDYEYHAMRNSAALIDVSPLFKYEVRGRDALRFLNRVMTRDARRCAVGQALYTCFCNGEGRVIQDGTAFRLGEDYWRIHLADPSLRWFQVNATGMDVKIDDVSEEIAAVALQGPTSRDILKQLCDADMDRLKFFRLTSARIGEIPGVISRTGYTGDLGYEIWIPSSHAERLWDTLMEAGKNYGIMAAGMLALDMARLEAGFVLIEVDYISAEKALIPSQKYSPSEIGLEWTVSFEKGNFVGRRALWEEKQQGSPRQMVGLEVDWEDYERLYQRVGLAPGVPTAAWRGGVPVYRNGRQVGKATTGSWSPTLKKYIALATVRRDCADLGSTLKMEVTVEHTRQEVKARVVKRPFFDPPRKRT